MLFTQFLNPHIPIFPKSSNSSYPTTSGAPFNHPTNRSMETSLRTGSTSRNNHKADHQSAAIDCFFFIFFGTCGFGPACRFNHPMLPSVDEQEAIADIYGPPIRPCKYFFSGFCKHGASCLFDHAFPKPPPNYSLHFNAYGFPKRWGMPDCSFYMRNGTCGYGTACKFHHPEPVLYYPHDQGYGSYAGGEVVECQRSYTPVSNGCYQWYQRKPVTITIREPCVTLNDVGLPLRPDKKACRNYENNGCCKYGKGCKFNHPMKGSVDDEKSPDNQE